MDPKNKKTCIPICISYSYEYRYEICHLVLITRMMLPNCQVYINRYFTYTCIVAYGICGLVRGFLMVYDAVACLWHVWCFCFLESCLVVLFFTFHRSFHSTSSVISTPSVPPDSSFTTIMYLQNSVAS